MSGNAREASVNLLADSTGDERMFLDDQENSEVLITRIYGWLALQPRLDISAGENGNFEFWSCWVGIARADELQVPQAGDAPSGITEVPTPLTEPNFPWLFLRTYPAGLVSMQNQATPLPLFQGGGFAQIPVVDIRPAVTLSSRQSLLLAYGLDRESDDSPPSSDLSVKGRLRISYRY